MLYLAQVKSSDTEGKTRLQFLALQKADCAWAVLNGDERDLWVEAIEYSEGALVLVELSATRQVQQIQDAIPWLLEVIDQHLTYGITPANLQEEVQRAEQWRQSLTLQSQELGRRSLELEARREQIQELEENLKREQERLEALAEQLKANAANSAAN